MKFWSKFANDISLELGRRFGGWLFSGHVMVIWIPLATITFIAFLSIALVGPHMKNQPHILTYETVVSVPPSGTIPVEKEPLWPLVDTISKGTFESASAEAGKVYYGYYCIFCHGDGNHYPGPVGESFVPEPPSLLQAAIQKMDNVELEKKMVNGVGHDPLFKGVISPDHRKSIALYVHTLGSETKVSKE